MDLQFNLTCRVVIPIKLEFSAPVGFIHKEFVTIHGHTILKFSVHTVTNRQVKPNKLRLAQLKWKIACYEKNRCESTGSWQYLKPLFSFTPRNSYRSITSKGPSHSAENCKPQTLSGEKLSVPICATSRPEI
jgi:hypothetical protein